MLRVSASLDLLMIQNGFASKVILVIFRFMPTICAAFLRRINEIHKGRNMPAAARKEGC